MTDYKVQHGGLMRCCLLSLDEQLQAGLTAPECQCQYCRNWMRLDDLQPAAGSGADHGGVWRWDRERARAAEDAAQNGYPPLGGDAAFVIFSGAAHKD